MLDRTAPWGKTMLLAFPFPSSRDKELRGILERALAAEMAPHLSSLGFKRIGDSSALFPARYLRMDGNRIDRIEFQWARNGSPAFIINFDIAFSTAGIPLAQTESKCGIEACACRAGSRSYLIERWFHIGYLDRLFRPKAAAVREAHSARQRITEIDNYARTGESSPYRRDISPGNYQRLRDRT